MVSILGFGCMRLPLIDGKIEQIDENKAQKMIEYAINNGVNYFDTAFPYHSERRDKGGMSEIFVGEALKKHRKNVYLATKLPSWLIQTRGDMDRFLDLQLERIQTDYIDFYLMHCLNEVNWLNLKSNDVYNFLESAINDGRIRYAGFSFHDEYPLFKEIVDSYDWSFCQIQYNYMDNNYQAGEQGLNYAANKGLGIAIMEPLRGGSLATVVPQDIQQIWDKADIKRTPVEWALRYLWNRPEINIVLSGMTKIDHVVENIKIADEGLFNSLTDKEFDIINEVREIYQTRSRVNCTGCQYCMPCPAGVNIPVNFTHLNNHAIYKHTQVAKYQYSVFIPEPQQASKCVGCGKCEKACPQNIPVREILKEVVETFEK
jgi:predicted aldo/keto reductase-like oxidoreductase